VKCLFDIEIAEDAAATSDNALPFRAAARHVMLLDKFSTGTEYKEWAK
jgi:hypothetical protein